MRGAERGGGVGASGAIYGTGRIPPTRHPIIVAAALTLPSPRWLRHRRRRLPGEAQKIDRIMEKFAERYCRDNPQAFKNGVQGLGGVWWSEGEQPMES